MNKIRCDECFFWEPVPAEDQEDEEEEGEDGIPSVESSADIQDLGPAFAGPIMVPAKKAVSENPADGPCGTCHLHPPAAHCFVGKYIDDVTNEETEDYAWPLTRASEWCGDGKKKG